MLGVLLLSLLVSWLTHSSYEDHQALAFTSVTKNQSVAAAIATLALGPTAALAPAIIPIIQPILAIAYIHIEKSVRSLLTGKNDTEAQQVDLLN
jgi:ACR3 family arsenite efflux pump ArsB